MKRQPDTNNLPRSVTPNHRYGQHFLTDKRVLAFEVRTAQLSGSDTVLEIGPGTGNLTRELAATAGQVVTVELDSQFRPILEKLTERYRNVTLIWGDAITTEFPPFNKAVCNLPYKVSLPLLFRLFEYPFELAVVIVQLRLARKICARPGTVGYGAITVALQRLGTFDLLRTVDRQSFSPAPAVDSAVVRIAKHANPFAVDSETHFRRLLDAMFLRRSLTVEQNLRRIIPADKRGQVCGMLQRVLRNTKVSEVEPRDFAQIASATSKSGIHFPEVPTERKRTTQKSNR